MWDTAYLLEEDDEDEAKEGGQLDSAEKAEAMEEDEAGGSGRPAVTVADKGKAKVDDVAETDSDEDSNGKCGWIPIPLVSLIVSALEIWRQQTDAERLSKTTFGTA